MFPQKFIDQLGRQVDLPSLPKRLISLVPSHTESLFDLGLNDSIVGITKFCTIPAEFVKAVEKVGGTKQLNLEKIAALDPDLIIANKEENTRKEIEWLMERFPVWVSDIFNLEDAYEMISQVGKMTARESKAESLIAVIRQEFDSLRLIKSASTKCVLYLIWKDPFMAAGSNTFINHIVEVAGFENAVKEPRYPILTESEIREINPQLIFLSSEPYPFKEKHIDLFKAICPNAKIILVDGEIFSWYGSRLKFTPSYLRAVVYSLVNS